MKTEKNVFVRLLTAVCVSAFLGGVFAAPAQAAFPQDQAGIAAYVKLEGVNQTTFNNALQNFFDYTEPSGDTYMIGVKGYIVDNLPYDPYARNKIDIHFYLGIDGWLAAYLLKDDPAAKIVNWRDGAELKNTLLEVALNDAIAKIGAATTEEIKYYDFSKTSAKKMTIIKEIADNNEERESFSALIPGELGKASFSLASLTPVFMNNMMALSLNSNRFVMSGQKFLWGNYDFNLFRSGASNDFLLEKYCGGSCAVAAATVLVYNPY